MTDASEAVLLVDDDPSVLKALARLLRAAGLTVATFSAAGEVLAYLEGGAAGCVVLDLRMPEVDGLELQALLGRADDLLPIVFLSGHGDVQSSVQAMKAGAIDFLTKPCDEERLLAAVAQALARNRQARAARAERETLRVRFDRLTRRERQVCELVARGLLNKQVAFALGSAEKTVKVHRARVMQKLEVESLAELVRLVDRWRAAG